LGCLAERLVDMPVLRGWYRDAVVSDGVVRAIVWAVRNLTRAQRRWVDETLRGNRGRIGDLGADELVGAVQRLADQARPELCRDRQRRAFDRRSVTAQPRLDGTGGLLLADLDAEGFETVITALDTFTDTDTGTGDDTDIADGANDTDTDDDGADDGDGDGDGDGGFARTATLTAAAAAAAARTAAARRATPTAATPMAARLTVAVVWMAAPRVVGGCRRRHRRRC
jgi:hypothetical protein